MSFLHLLEQFVDRLCLGNKIDLANQWSDIFVFTAFRPALQQIAHVNHSFNVIHLITKDRESRVFGFEHYLSCFTHSRSICNRNYSGSRCHHFTHTRISKLDYRVNQFTFLFFKNSFRRPDINQCLHTAVVVLFLFLGCFSDLISSSRPIKQSLKRIGNKGHDGKERTNQWQQKEQRAFGIACGDKEWNELTKNTCENKTGDK